MHAESHGCAEDGFEILRLVICLHVPASSSAPIIPRRRWQISAVAANDRQPKVDVPVCKFSASTHASVVCPVDSSL
jgi:hypothetical protein